MIELLCSANSDYHTNFMRDLVELLQDYPEVEATIEDGRYSKSRKKGFQIKNRFGANLDPFVGIKIDGDFKKGFYSEVNECTISNIKAYLDENL